MGLDELKHYVKLTEAERRVLRYPADEPIISVLKGLSSEEKKRIYRAIKIKREYFSPHFKDMQRTWLEDHEGYLDGMLKEKHLDHSHEVIEGILSNEIISDEGENVRFRIYYSAKYRGNIEPPSNKELTDFLTEVDCAIEFFKSPERASA